MARAKMGFLATGIAAAIACGAPSPPPTAQPPTFECGKKTCDASQTYCERQLADAQGPQSEVCKPLPGPCRSARDCSCFPIDTPCVMFKQCSVAPAGDRVGLTVTCPSG